MNPFWLGSGSCVTTKVSAAIYALNCQCRGFSEFGSQSSPPVYYRKYSTAGGWSITRTEAGHPPWTNEGVGLEGAPSGYAWDAATGVLATDYGGGDPRDLTINVTNEDNDSDPSSSFSSDRLIQESWAVLSLGGSTPSGLSSPPSDVVTQLSGDLFIPATAILSKTQLRLTQTAQTSVEFPDYSCTAGTFDFELSDADSDDDAAERAMNIYLGYGYSAEVLGPLGPDLGEVFSGRIFSLCEKRAVDSFLHQSGTYWLNCAGLSPGVLHRYVVVWEGRDANGDGSGDESGYGSTWSNTDSQSGTFRPTGTTFDTDPITMPIAYGKQKRIKSISVTPMGG